MAHELTKIELSALRKANRIVFRHYNGTSQIECIKELTDKEKEDSPFETEKRVIVECDMRFNDYSEKDCKVSYDDNFRYHNNFKAFETISFAQLHDIWKTIVDIIKAGDYLTLNWRRDALRTENLKDNQLYGDDLQLVIIRGEKVLTFHIDSSICPDNSARMIQKLR